jgi:hypothetical protein
MGLYQFLKEGAAGRATVIFIEDIYKDEVTDNHKSIGCYNGIKGLTLFLSHREHLFSIFKKHLNCPPAGV